MTNGIVESPTLLPTQYRQTERLQEAVSYRAESTDVSYTDADGRSFNLSLRTETVSYAMTYDRTAQVRGGEGRDGAHHAHHKRHGRREGHRGELNGLREEFKEVEKALKQAGIEVKGFKKLLHRMLKSADSDYRGHFRRQDPLEEEFAVAAQVHVELAAVEQNLTIEMDQVDPVYWSAENTAQRLVDFATALHQGGDRGDHLEQMVAGMKQGYEEAAQAFGGVLPEIAQDTIDLAIEMLQEWAAEAEEPAEPLDLVA
jgi:hypothetical protein